MIIMKINTRFCLFCCLVVTLTSGCTTIGYYYQSINGQLELIEKRVPIDSLLTSNDTSVEQLNRLNLVKSIRNFASSELGLPDNNSYRYYVNLNRDYVVWNVFAAPEFSLEGKTWCFLIVGCLGYRGYFSRDAAEDFAEELSRQGFDVFVGGVTAYSTLGWFDDPVLNTMLRKDDNYLLKVIFHELAHQKIYIRDDTRFNEAFAETVAIEGARRWHEQHGTELSRAWFDEAQLHEEQFTNLVLDYRDKLEKVYLSPLPADHKRIRKQQLLDEMKTDYRILHAGWGNDHRYENWFSKDINNAKLLAVTTYRLLVPAFRKLLELSGNDLPEFYTMIEKLGACAPVERESLLLSGSSNISC